MSLITNLQSYYKFNGNGLDSSGLSRTLFYTGIEAYGTGKFGGGYSLPDDNANFATGSNSTDLDFAGAGAVYAISLWVNLDTNGSQVLCEKVNASLTNGWTLYRDVADGISFQFAAAAGMSTPGNIFAPGSFHHIVVRSNGTNVRIYIDGVQQASTSTPNILTNTESLLIGNRIAGNSPLDGIIDELAIWDRSLSDLEIAQLYNSGAGLEITADILVDADNTIQLDTVADGIKFIVVPPTPGSSVGPVYQFVVDDITIPTQSTGPIYNYTLNQMKLSGTSAGAIYNAEVFATDTAGSTIELSTVADAIVIAPNNILVDADNTVEFDTVADETIPSIQADADSTVEFDTPASEDAIFSRDAESTTQFDSQAQEIAELGLDAESTAVFSSGAGTDITVSASSTIQFGAAAMYPPMEPFSNIVIHGSTYHRKDNISGPQGGPIDYCRKIAIGPVPFLTPIGLVSSKADDVGQVYLIEGMGPRRSIERELVTLNGTELVFTNKVFTRLCRIEKQSGTPLVGTITACSGASIIGTMESSEISGSGCEIESLHNFLANTVGRATVDTAFYEKFFIRNNSNVTIARLVVSEHQSDFKDRVLFAADPSFDNNSTSRNRLTKPGAVNPGDFLTDDTLVFTNIPAGASIGIWLRLVIPAGEGTVLNGWKIKIDSGRDVFILDLLHPEGSGGAGSDTFQKRYLHPVGGGNSLRYVELGGARFVEQVYYEPDPRTFRDQFYYNARQNRLFKKLNTKPVPIWKVVR